MSSRFAVKLAYDGRGFYGSQRQPGVLTVEDEAISCLREIRAIEGAEGARFRCASRTDRGVSALGNVIAFDTDFPRDELLGAMNAATRKVYFHAIAEVPASFSPRRAARRWYRYFLPAEGLDLDLAKGCAGLFVGEHDFRRFCKADGRSTVRKVDSMEVFPVGVALVIDVRAREFLRNMVRRMVAAVSEVASGRAGLMEVRERLDGKEGSFGLAPAENLCLMDISYPFDFEAACPPTLERRLAEASHRNFVEMAFLGELAGRCRPEP